MRRYGGPRRLIVGSNGVKDQRTERAATRMSRVVASGCEINATCDALTSTAVACARAAMKRRVVGGIAVVLGGDEVPPPSSTTCSRPRTSLRPMS